MSLAELSSDSLLAAFFLYTFSFIFFVVAITGKRFNTADPQRHAKRWGNIGFGMAVLGLIGQLTFFFTRWVAAGHIPTSNMFEFMTFLGMMIMIAFIIVYLIYKVPVLGAFSMPVGVIIIAYASVFPQDITPLIPALQSYWLKIHVTTAATGEAFFAVGFAAGMMHLMRTVKFGSREVKDRRKQRGVEFTILFVFFIVAFVISAFGFKGIGYEAHFTQEKIVTGTDSVPFVQTETVDYFMPPIVKPYNSQVVTMDSFLGISQPLFEAPSWMNGVNAGRKLNTVLWSLLTGLLLYWLLRLVLRQPIGAAIQPAMEGLDPEDLDEISYRAIAIGYPIFSLGALIFAMIWAQEAWGRFWGWDPKEVWALITWLFYTAYLHLRLSRGWQGERSSWLSVIGFIIVMFTLVGVNLIIAGLHSYAGV
ncbi:cytochrome c biogenesis protein CcsA [Paenibacillus sp. y28]|uniref:cytochrome c biogenesis protein CcsA n=1 Tax=Paenibacillus sp. y28 TaxID=3129110 RepID=UPI0030188566